MASFLETLYPILPIWAQNLGVSVYGYGWRRERLGGAFEDHVAQFRDRDRWPQDRFEEYLAERLRGVLAHAFAQVPHYEKAWRQAGITNDACRRFQLADLARLPVTRKEQLRESPEDFVARDVAGCRKLRRYSSSGTTGTPITAICTADGHRRFVAAREARSFGWAGATLLGSRSMIGGRLVVPKAIARPPFHRYNWVEKQLYFSAFHISPANAPHYVAALNRYRPKVLTGYASSHYLLARMMLEQDLTLDYEPDALVLSSEKLTAPMKDVLRRSFRARAYEEYGSVENCGLATECENGCLHANQDFGIIEIVDEQGRPTPPGVEGRVLCTSLCNEAQPLIRYEMGDIASWSGESCACGRGHLPVFKEIVGRLEDVVTGPDGRQLVRFHGIFIGLPSVLEGQVIQEALDRFTVRLVAIDSLSGREAQLIRGRFEERLGRVQITIERVAEIPRTERGKFRSVVSRIRQQGSA